MIVGLEDDASDQAAAVATAEELANMFGAAIPVAQSISTPQSTITIYPPTLKPAPRAPGVGSGVLDAILPKKIGTDGKEKIWGLPPAVAYAIVGVIGVGGAMMLYHAVAGRGRRAATNPRRRGRAKRRARYKR